MGSKENVDFLETVDKGIDKDDLSLLTEKTKLLRKKEKEIEKLNEKLQKLNEEARILSREEIPEFLMSKGLKKIELSNGLRVEVQEKISLTLPKKDLMKRTIALNWLVKNGGEAIITTELHVTDPEKKLKDWLMEQDIPYADIKDVNHARLKSFVSAKLGMKKGSLPEIETSDIPKEFNLFIYNETKLSI
jgi:hypothetical protein